MKKKSDAMSWEEAGEMAKKVAKARSEPNGEMNLAVEQMREQKKDEIAEAEAASSDETVRDLTDEERALFFEHVFKKGQ